MGVHRRPLAASLGVLLLLLAGSPTEGRRPHRRARWQPRSVTPRGPKPPWRCRRRRGVKLALRRCDPHRNGAETKRGCPVFVEGDSRLRPRRLRPRRPSSRRAAGLSRLRLQRLGLRPRGLGRVDLRRWPAEPKTPARLTAAQLAGAMRQLCHPEATDPKRLHQLAPLILDAARRRRLDPLLLAALVYHQSGCRGASSESWGIGLTRINYGMWRFQQGRLRYGVLVGGAWHPRYLLADPYRYTRRALRRPRVNLHIAAGLLAMYRAQCPQIDGHFGSVPHRHFVSHFVWGDQVQNAGTEDQILRARRRLIGYLAGSPRPRARFAGSSIYAPIDGAPLRVISVMYDDRDGGKRAHLGIDLASFQGEPVRAIAAGTVTFAGVERRRGGFIELPPQQTRYYPRQRMGPRGLFVIIRHSAKLSSLYVHNESNAVRTGQTVRGGQLIGRVGRSGIRVSAAHLHLGLRLDGRLIDPLRAVGVYSYLPSETYLGRHQAHQQARRRKRMWRQRRRLRRQRR